MKGRMFLFAIAVLYVTGNLTADCLSYHIDPHTIALSSAVAAAIGISLIGTMPKASLLSVFCTGCLGASVYNMNVCSLHDSSMQDGEECMVEGIVADKGLSSSGRPWIEVILPDSRTIIYNIPPRICCLPGDTVSAYVKVSKVRNFSPDFDYVRHMARRKILYTCLCLDRKRQAECRPCGDVPLSLIPARLRHNFSKKIEIMFRDGSSAGTAAVVKALAYGYQDEIPKTVKESFRNSGAIHLLALSGMHLGLIYAFLHRLMALLTGNSPATRRVRSILILCALWSYTIFTGSGVSILRAAVTFTIYEAGILAGRKKDGLSAMSASAVIITTADPSSPSSISFQLTYAAMTAIFLIYPYLRSAISPGWKPARLLTDACAMTIACQVTTAPVILLHFGTFAFFSLIANLLCSPLVSAAMILIPVSLLCSGIDGHIFRIPSLILEAIIGIFIDINKIISSL